MIDKVTIYLAKLLMPHKMDAMGQLFRNAYDFDGWTIIRYKKLKFGLWKFMIIKSVQGSEYDQVRNVYCKDEHVPSKFDINNTVEYSK